MKFKYPLLSFLFLVLISGFTFVSAAETPTQKQVLVGTVNIENAKIISQQGNTFKLSFIISNRERVQTGIKYGVKLIAQNGKTPFVVDEKVYDESLTLLENSKIEREITYTAPNGLNGEYTLYINNQNESGFPFGIASFGTVSFVSSIKGVEIVPNSCYLTVEGDKKSDHYELLQGVDIGDNESLRLNCSATNKSTSPVTITPTFETRYRSLFGDIVPALGGDVAPTNFAKNETKNFSLVLPKAITPQFYDLKITFSSIDGATNSFNVRYIVRGAQATIQNVSLDKNSYSKGETAKISMVWSQTSGQFLRNSSNLASSVKVDVQINDVNGLKCVEPFLQTLTRTANPVTELSIPVTSDCKNPQISVSLKDAQDRILDKKEFNFKTNFSGESDKSKSFPWIPTIIGLVIIIGAAVFMNRKKTTTSSI